MTNLLTWWRALVSPHPLLLVPGDFGGLWRDSVRVDVPDVEIRAYPEKIEPPPSHLHGRRRVNLLRVESVADVLRFEEWLFQNRIDAIAFDGAPEIAAAIAYHQFDFYLPASTGMQKVSSRDVPPHGECLAIHPRFMAPPSAGPARLDLPALFKRFNLAARGVIHAGPGEGAAIDLYAAMGFLRMIFLESNPAAYARLTQRARGRQDITCLFCAVGEQNGLEVLRVNDGGVDRPVPVQSRRLDYVIREIGQNPADFNLLQLNLRGDELKALHGAEGLLPALDAIATEVHFEEDVPGAAIIEDVDDYVRNFGYERLITLTPGNPQRGDAFYLRHPAVSMRNLGRWGRFGNQVFEYTFIKIFGKRHRLRVETSSWPGNQLFGACDPLPARQYPQHLEQTYALADSKIARLDHRPFNFDACGVFQYHTAYYAPEKQYFRELLSPVPALKNLLDDGLHRARGNTKTLVALHLRRGDYGYGLFFIPPNAWYLNWLKALWPTLDAPALYIATDEPAKVLPDFAAYQPISAANLKLPGFGADYYPDYYVLSQADHVAISNSSFSFSACMLNERSRTFLRPDFFAGKLITFDPWNAEPLLHRELGIFDHKTVTQALPQYLARPNEPQLINFMRNARAQIAESFSQINADQIDLVLGTHGLWACYQDLQKANLRPQQLVDAEKQILSRIMDRLQEGLRAGGKAAIGPYIAATMFVHSTQLPSADLSSLRADILEVLRL